MRFGAIERRNSGTVERWNGGTVERWNGGTVERWNGGTVRDGRLGSFLCSVGFAGSCTLSHDVALTAPTAGDKWNHFEYQNAREHAKTPRINPCHLGLQLADIRVNSRQFAFQIVPSVPAESGSQLL